MRRLILLLLIPTSLFLCGCPKKAQYVRPAAPVPGAWPESPGMGEDAPGAAVAFNMDWKEFFMDRQLQSVIGLALENNRDLRVAALNIEKAQALYRIQSAERRPVVAASAGAEGYRVPENMAGDGDSQTVAQYTVGVGIASWELDFFGRIKNYKSSALEQYLATEQARSAAQISIVAAVANAYLALAADRENLKLAEATMNAQQASYDLIRQSRELGIASDLVVRQAQTQVESARVDIARYSGRVAQGVHAINLLVGIPVPDELLPRDLNGTPAMKEIAAGLPSDVLLRRPDILAAEHRLKACYANINAARARFFPRISLTAGAVGFVSSDLADLFKWGSRTWNFIPQATLPLFDSGARSAGVKVAEADRDIAVAQYEKSIQEAFREASDALSFRATLLDQQQAQQSLVNALEETYRLSEARYKGGIDSYLSVLVAQRSLNAAQQQLVGTRLARLSNLVNLYKVLGGGL